MNTTPNVGFKRLIYKNVLFFRENKKCPLQQGFPTVAGTKIPADRIILLDFYLPEAY